MQTKLCNKCLKIKPLADFYADKSRRVCKKCKNHMTLPTSRIYTARNKALVLRHYSPELKCSCLKCPFPYPGIDFLSLDHIDGKGSHTQSLRKHLYHWIKSNGFPAGFQVLCFNCNLAKRAGTACPHMREMV